MRLTILALAILLLTPDYNVAFRPPAAGAQNRITQFFAGGSGEPPTAAVNEVFYSFPFGMAGTNNDSAVDCDPGTAGTQGCTEADAFQILPVAGTLSHFAISTPYCSFDASESATMDIRVSSTGAPGTWSTTSFSTTASGTSTCFWDEDVAATVDVAAEDVFSKRLTMGATAAPSGPSETLSTFMTFTPDDPNTFVMTSAVVLAGVSTSDRHFSPIGFNTGLNSNTNYARACYPIPVDMTLTKLCAALQSNQTVDRTYAICKYDGTSDDANCGGTNIGDELMSVTITTGDTDAKICTTSCLTGSCALTAGDCIYNSTPAFDTSPNNNDDLVSVASAWTTSGGKWANGACGLTIDNTNDDSYAAPGQAGYLGSQICLRAGTEISEQQCQTYVPIAATATHARGRLNAVLGAGTWALHIREGGAGTPANSADEPTCNLDTSNASCSATGSATFDAGDYFNFRHDQAGGVPITANQAYCHSVAWDDLVGGD